LDKNNRRKSSMGKYNMKTCEDTCPEPAIEGSAERLG
jgi:hypothetical protein